MLKEIRSFLRDIGANAIVIPHNDSYFNDDLRPENERLAYVTGFTGSAGLAIITPRQAVLFVDGRYVEQAKKQTKFKVFHVPKQTTVSEWLIRFLRPNYVLAYDPWLQSVAQIENWAEIFTKRGAKLLSTEFNPVDKFWLNKPKQEDVNEFVYPAQYAGKTTAQKLQPIRRILKEKELDAFVLTNVDTISWLLNKRSDAVSFNPVYLDRLIIYPNGKPVSFNEKTAESLKGKVVAVDAYETPIKIKQILTNLGASVRKMRNPFSEFQSVKNETEVFGMQQAALLDSIAVCKFFAQLPSLVKKENEHSAMNYLKAYRRESVLFKHESFENISAVDKNAALPHYQANAKQNTKLANAKLYLLDTGGQYWCGTTDMTRTVAVGKVTQEMKIRYTQVLKGHIALASQIFPAGTTGGALDVLARQFLWQDGVDFDHGTGHGIGCFLNVHETPPSISPRDRNPLKENMILSNEPGFYLKGKFGIRTENMMQVVKAKKKGYLAFQMLTFVPFCDELIQKDMLSGQEREWIAQYYSQIMQLVYPNVNVKVQKWLMEQMGKWMPENNTLTC